MNDVVAGSYRDGERIRKLRERLTLAERQGFDAGLEGTVFVETATLWIEVLHTGSRFRRNSNASPGEQADAEQTSFVSRMDQSKIGTAIDGLVELDPHEESAGTQSAGLALVTLRTELLNLTAGSSGSAGEGLPRLFADDSTPRELDAKAHIAVWLSRTTLLLELHRASRILRQSMSDVNDLAERVTQSAAEAKVASDELEGIREQLNEARAERARGKLADQFKTLYRREGNTSWGFRVVAFGLLVVAAVTGYKLAGSQSTDWQSTATHVAIVSVLAGASAYAARLAAAHRGTADWAKSIQVQLETFQDFLGAIEDDATRHRVYEDFGRRVLGPPPIAGEDPGTMPTAQLVEMLISSSRRAPRDGA